MYTNIVLFTSETTDKSGQFTAFAKNQSA